MYFVIIIAAYGVNIILKRESEQTMKLHAIIFINTYILIHRYIGLIRI